jgi:hypothetical protein
MAKSLTFTHILQTDFAKQPDKPTRLAETGRISALSSRPPSTFPKMWVKVRAKSQGLLHSPTSGTDPLGLMWDTSCPMNALTLVAMQDVFSSIVVTIQFSSTVRARVPSHTEVFLDNASTPTTGLRCAMRSHFHDGATSLFRFVATHRDEGSPACIQDTFL